MAEEAKKEKKIAAFISPIKSLRIYWSPPVVQIVQGFGKIVEQGSGKYTEFQHGRYQTSDKNEIKLLMEHKYFQVKFFPDPADPTNFWLDKGYYKEEDIKVRKAVDPMAIVEEGRKQAEAFVRSQDKRMQSIRTAS